LKKSSQFIARLAILLALTLLVQMLGLPQPITGPLINMFLFLTLWILNLKAAVLLGVLTPLIAAWRGQLPAVLFPMVPFIGLGNAVLVISFRVTRYYFARFLNRVSQRHPLLVNVFCITSGAILKFTVLYLSANVLIPYLVGSILPEKVILMMSTPQFITAMIGGILALVLYQFFRKISLLSN
jgi:hypothetical protein